MGRNNAPPPTWPRDGGHAADSLSDIQNSYARAVEHHRAGRLAEAQQLYRQVLAADSRHADCLHLLGVMAAQTGDAASAIDLIGQAIGVRNDVHVYHISLGNALRRQGRLADAVAAFRNAATLKPGVAEVHNNIGNVLKEQGKLAEAVTQYRRALGIKPDYAEAHNNLGSALLEQGRIVDAVACYERAVGLKPDVAELHNNLGNARMSQGRLDDAAVHFERALALKAGYAEAHNNLGNVRKKQNRLAEAAAQYECALGLRPGYAEAHNNLGNTLMAQGKLADALTHYQRALELGLDAAELHNNLGNVFTQHGDPAAAIAHFQRALALRPDVAEVHNNLGNALLREGRFADALAEYQRAIALRPDSADAYSNLGNAHKELGSIAEAVSAYEKAIALAPRAGVYYRHLVETRRVLPDDRYLADMETLALDMASLPTGDQKELHFALAKACADQQQHERAFNHCLAANALKRAEIVYDEPATLAVFDRIRAVFDSDMMRGRRGLGDPSRVPIFIVGMPRSGTTLVEQILASHSGVFGAGERNDIERSVARPTAQTDALPFPELVPGLSDEVLRALGTSYVEGTVRMAPEATRVTDKMPGNFLFLGLIHLTLPHARIIHMKRHPLDTCLSCFMLQFGAGQAYSYDLRELGRYYRGYQALMQHWRRVLPAEAMLEVQYEDVVADVEQQARRVVAYCGLEWEKSCLDFHRTQRPVRTASAIQVRQPIYRSSVGRWRLYERFLQPLIEELGLTDQGLD
jgi:tetratricopeptide (TPR) repeat protein